MLSFTMTPRHPRHLRLQALDRYAIARNQQYRHSVKPGDSGIERRLAAAHAVHAHVVNDRRRVRVAKRRVGIAYRAMIAREEDAGEIAAQAFGHRKRFTIAEYDSHVVRQFVEQQIAHGAVRIVDEHLARARLARSVDRRPHLRGHIFLIDEVLGRIFARIALLPTADAGGAFHIA